MLLIEAKDYNDMSRKAANIISAQVIMKPHAVLGLQPDLPRSVLTNSSLSGTTKVTLISQMSPA